MRLLFVLVPVIVVAGVLVALFTKPPELPLNSGAWTRTDNHTVALVGTIDSGNFFGFRRVFDDRVRTVVLNSGGGLTYEAVQIGMTLKDAGVDVVVDGVCLSSCANYLFTAGRRKTIQNGVVGFHGNTRAMTEEENVQASIRKVLGGLGEAERRAYRAELEQTLAWERTFFADLGVDQALFDRTQRPDKGMDNGETYAFLLPTPATFRRYGIHNVEGVQSSRVMRAVEKEVSLPLLID